MIELTPKQARAQLLRVLASPRPKAVALRGAPGCAKTATWKWVAHELRAVDFECHPCLQEPIDYNGLSWVVNGEVRQLPMEMVRQIIAAAKAEPERLVIVGFEDVGQAPSSTQAAVAQWALARRFNEQVLPDNVRIVLTTNRRKDKAGVSNIISMLTNRVRVYDMCIDVDGWAEWIIGESGLPADVSGMFAAFSRFKPECFADAEQLTNRDMDPFCTARSLFEAASDWAEGMTNAPSMMANIGESRAVEALAFFKLWQDLPDPRDILADPDKAKVPDRRRADILFALAGALAVHVTTKTIAALTIYCDRLIHEAQRVEIAVACIKDAQTQKPELQRAKALANWLYKHHEVLGASDDR